MHNEYLIVSRGSIARGLSVRMPDNFGDPEIAASLGLIPGETGKKSY